MGRRSLMVVPRGAGCVLAAMSFAWGCAGDGDTTRGPRIPGGSGSSGTGTGAGSGSPGGGGIGNVGNSGSAASGAAGTGVSSGGTGGGIGGAMECASALVNTTTTTPTILFVIDGSGSMCETFGGSTRWQALRTALLEPTNGLIPRMQSQVVFGATIYDGTIDLFLAAGSQGGSPAPQCAGMYTQTKMMGMCPQLIQVAPALDNAAALDAAFPATELGGSTPTDKAMKSAVDLMLAMRSTNPDVVNNPLYIILATDGAPNDICVGGVGGDTAVQKAAVVAEVDRAAAANITTFVISLAGSDQALQQHLEEVADHGEPMNPNAHTFSPETPEDLTNALAVLVGGAIGCEVTLNGMVTMGQECRGLVEINGTQLPCCQDRNGWMCNAAPVADPSGWVLKDERTVELVGTECLNFLQAPEASLRATFPCDVFSPD